MNVADGVWRFAFAFAFDPKRRGILLCGGDKSGGAGEAGEEKVVDAEFTEVKDKK